MNNTMKVVSLEPKEFLLTLSVVKILKKVAIEQKDNDEASLMDMLITELISYNHGDDNQAKLELDIPIRFAFWLSIDTYCDFCKSSGYQRELNEAKQLMRKFQ